MEAYVLPSDLRKCSSMKTSQLTGERLSPTALFITISPEIDKSSYKCIHINHSRHGFNCCNILPHPPTRFPSLTIAMHTADALLDWRRRRFRNHTGTCVQIDWRIVAISAACVGAVLMIDHRRWSAGGVHLRLPIGRVLPTHRHVQWCFRIQIHWGDRRYCHRQLRSVHVVYNPVIFDRRLRFCNNNCNVQ